MTHDMPHTREREVQEKLAWLRDRLSHCSAQGIRLRGSDWFAWVTAGASNTVLLATETGVAEVLVTQSDAIILTDAIEAERLRAEEVPDGFTWHITPWAQLPQREQFVTEATSRGTVLSDRPQRDERTVPAEFLQRRLCLSTSEHTRYRDVGQRAARAMQDVLLAARPTWTEYELAGAGAEALWAQGLHPALTLAAGASRVARYRHPTPSSAVLGTHAMLVFCARGFGLYANLTRFVYFTSLTAEQQRRHEHMRAIEAAGLRACQPGHALHQVYDALAQAYHVNGYATALHEHHQGGLTGYQAREIIATPHTTQTLASGMAVALNPSLAGVKIEDTFLLQPDGLENVTLTPDWPSIAHDGRLRPVPLERGS